jgi:lipopolysaccharide export system permease protein
MKLLDRMLLASFFKAWGVCFISLLSLYLVIDLFNKIDEFVEASHGQTQSLVEIIALYYGYQIILIFDRLCGVIVLIAAMFTISWMQRNNEFISLLSAGIPVHRILRPLYLGTLTLVVLGLVNREMLMPRLAEQLQNPATDPRGEKVILVYGGYEPNGILITGVNALRKGRVVSQFTCTIPERVAGTTYHVAAREARYVPSTGDPLSGGWLLTECNPPILPDKWEADVLVQLDPGKFFLRTHRVDFDLATRNPTWYQYASTWEIYSELQHSDSTRLASMAVQLHLRLTVPMLTIIMVVMGVATILGDQNRNVYLNAGMSIVSAGLFFAMSYFAKFLGESEYVTPALAAWIPVLCFGPFALVRVDSIHT